jgi:hypothetical protein
MPFHPGDIVSFDFLIPSTGQHVTHSAVVLSCTEVYQHDCIYVCAMMSSNNTLDRFTFKLDNSMLQSTNNKASSQIRCHLITYVDAAKVRPTQGSPYNRLTRQALQRLFSQINNAVFNF